MQFGALVYVLGCCSPAECEKKMLRGITVSERVRVPSPGGGYVFFFARRQQLSFAGDAGWPFLG